MSILVVCVCCIYTHILKGTDRQDLGEDANKLQCRIENTDLCTCNKYDLAMTKVINDIIEIKKHMIASQQFRIEKHT